MNSPDSFSPPGSNDLKTYKQLLLAAFFSIGAPMVLYAFKRYDNNALCRWDWVLSDVSLFPFFLWLTTITAAALFLSRPVWPANKPVVLLFLSFLTGMVFWGEPEVIMDASRYFMQAKYLKVHGIVAFWKQWGHDISAWTDLPLVPFLYGITFSVLGESRTAVQVVTTTFFSGSVLVTCLLGRALWDEESGFTAGLLLLCFPYLLLHIPLMMVDLATMFFLLLAIYAFIRALQEGTPQSLFFSAFTISMAMLVKYSNWLFLSVLPVISLCYMLENDWRTILKRTTQTVLLALLFITPILFVLQDTVWEQLHLLAGFQRQGLKKWSESNFSTFFFQIHPVVSLAALAGTVAAFRNRSIRFLIPVYLVLLVLVLQIRRIRYILPVFPLLALMAAYGLHQLKNRNLIRYLVLVSAGVSLVLAIGLYLPFTKRLSAVNIQSAGRFLDTINSQTVKVYTEQKGAGTANLNINIPLLDLFTSKQVYSLNKISTAPPSKKNSSFRFTWEQRLPSFYKPSTGVDLSSAALVTISTRPSPSLPRHISQMASKKKKHKSFTTNTGLFSYRTSVNIYYND
jgi:hypothetical protein